MINVDDLLKPIADDKPCGEDFTYDPAFQSLETLARGKPETQFGPAEEPDWKEVRDAALEVLGKSKHLGAGVILTVALLKTAGLEGFRDGMAVVHGFTEKYWNDLFPKLDAEDNNDPTERLNILNNLSGSGEPYRFTVQIKQLVLCESPALGNYTLQQILTAKAKLSKPAGGSSEPDGTGPDLNQVKAALRDAGAEQAQAKLLLVNELIGHANGIGSFLDANLGSGKGVNFQALDKLLEEMKNALAPFAPEGSVAPSEAGAETAGKPRPSGGEAAETSGPGMSGGIRSRADVIQALGLICDYYQSHEPSSPVPLILQRAQRLVDKDFMTIMSDLTPEALTQLRVITGAKDEAK